MRIKAWLNDSFSGILALAVIEVEPNEVPDPEQMIIMLDGDSVGHYGMKVELIGHEGFDIDKYIKQSKASKIGYASGQFGFPHTTALRSKRRWYRAHLSRD